MENVEFCNLYLPPVFVCFIHFCCVILIKHDDGDDELYAFDGKSHLAN